MNCIKNNKVPGILNPVYQRLISNKQSVLPKIGKTLNLEKYLIRGNGERYLTVKMYADAMEALLGAIYLDCNDLSKALIVVNKHWQPYVDSQLKSIKPQLLQLSIDEQLQVTKNHSIEPQGTLFDDDHFEYFNNQESTRHGMSVITIFLNFASLY